MRNLLKPTLRMEKNKIINFYVGAIVCIDDSPIVLKGVCMKHINVFVIYKGSRTMEEMLQKIDETIPYRASLDDKNTESYLVSSDLDLPEDILEKLYFATFVYPHKVNGKSVGLNYRFSFFNFPINGEYSDVKCRLEEKGFEFKPLSENMELLRDVFYWYLPVNHDGDDPPPYKRSYRKNVTQAYILPINMD